MLEREFEFFKAHQEELVQKYLDRFLVIKGQTLIGVYDSELEAYTTTKKDHEVGTFLIQQCLPGDEGYTRIFHRVFLPNLGMPTAL